MKRTLLIAVAVAGAFTLASSTKAESPKGDELQIAHETVVAPAPDMSYQSATPTVAGYQAIGGEGIAGSPKSREMFQERMMVEATPSDVVASAGYQAVGADGIAASPNSREQMDERGAQNVMVAPLK